MNPTISNSSKHQEAADSSVSSPVGESRKIKKPGFWKSVLCCFSSSEKDQLNEEQYDSEKRQRNQRQQGPAQIQQGQPYGVPASGSLNKGHLDAVAAAASAANSVHRKSQDEFHDVIATNTASPIQGSLTPEGKEGEGGSKFHHGRWSPTSTNVQYPQNDRGSSVRQTVTADKEGQVTENTQEILAGQIDDDDDLDGSHGPTSAAAAAAVIDLKSPQQQTPVTLNQPDSPFYHENVVNTSEQPPLLGPVPEKLKGRKCLVLDLDETLVHSSFKLIQQSDFVIPVEIESQYYNVYVIKRPGVDEFMKRAGELFEIVIFTASVSKYGDPLLDQLDVHNVIHHRLFRESCYNYNGNYIKNLDQLGRPVKGTIIIDNSPASYLLHPDHAVPVSSWFSDVHDNELLDMIPFLEDLASDEVDDVAMVLDVNI